jgi:hypothetical protein
MSHSHAPGVAVQGGMSALHAARRIIALRAICTYGAASLLEHPGSRARARLAELLVASTAAAYGLLLYTPNPSDFDALNLYQRHQRCWLHEVHATSPLRIAPFI